jgi:flagellar hook-basal body complex protein FliE
MYTNPISSNIINLVSPEPFSALSKVSDTLEGSESFANIFNEAFNTAAAADFTDKVSSLALLAGQTDDIAGLLIDSQKAEIALSLTLALRNKVLEAYTEIMRMQV